MNLGILVIDDYPSPQVKTEILQLGKLIKIEDCTNSISKGKVSEDSKLFLKYIIDEAEKRSLVWIKLNE